MSLRRRPMMEKCDTCRSYRVYIVSPIRPDLLDSSLRRLVCVEGFSAGLEDVLQGRCGVAVGGVAFEFEFGFEGKDLLFDQAACGSGLPANPNHERYRRTASPPQLPGAHHLPKDPGHTPAPGRHRVLDVGRLSAADSPFSTGTPPAEGPLPGLWLRLARQPRPLLGMRCRPICDASGIPVG